MTTLYLDIARHLYFLIVPFVFLPKTKRWEEIFYPKQGKLDNGRDVAFKSWKKIVDLELSNPWKDLSNTVET